MLPIAARSACMCIVLNVITHEKLECGMLAAGYAGCHLARPGTSGALGSIASGMSEISPSASALVDDMSSMKSALAVVSPQLVNDGSPQHSSRTKQHAIWE